ncbi:uncharacterized protein LACBIDRAFT_303035 [Laccaria bicolor S238N-H82]|uniref:Predicted protein n=1 Tax=Laccaria bicolor (strain S238N-H82 / ATCC MYA-4686) TaxID=486041 RepID=B0DIT3_LACBS|nr:uncharacterized protein LACBIDRAFT_303035 [Laccaria bicolor S238N-H82]EDR05287.1 predicted protein [Laccaria bicolor S238N-H82]|eukprot:XP_001883845.1 predicted protein [Laccaria bicolor S238N-H82]
MKYPSQYTNVMISIIGANRNPDIWGPDSLEWIPERWLSPLPSSVSDAHVPGIYSHLMMFMGGGRACVGFNFWRIELVGRPSDVPTLSL